jgi:hypothetical protein
MSFQSYRPPQIHAQADAGLARLSRDLKAVLSKVQRQLAYHTLRLPGRQLEELAHVLVEFAEDMHYQVGLWRSLEQYQLELFGTPLPLTLPPGAEPMPEDRLRHLLWVIYAEIEPELILSPTHQDLERLAAATASFLIPRLDKLPWQSSVKQFMDQSNEFGWDVKRKLIWLGSRSYLFRYRFQNYLAEHGGQSSIALIDDFVCQENTAWAGLGVIDILAGALPLSPEQRADLRSWYERHIAFYHVEAATPAELQLVNLVNEQPYRVKMDGERQLFKAGQVVFGGLVPWDGFWYWSGQQSLYGTVSKQEMETMRRSLIEKAPPLVYRYHSQLAAQAREMVELFHQFFVKMHGDDLMIFADGRTMAAAMQKMYRQYNEERLKAIQPAEKKKLKRGKAAPQASFPPEVRDNRNGIAVYFNRAEGIEMMLQFNDVVSGLQKRGDALTEDESMALEMFIKSEEISPQFVQRVVREYGAEAIGTAFFIQDRQDSVYLDYLLRRYKGHFYRNRYPSVTLIE